MLSQNLNKVIRKYNKLLRTATPERPRPKLRSKILALVEQGVQTWANVDGGSGWRDVLIFIKDQLDETVG